MKKILFTIIIFFMFAMSAFAKNVPMYKNSINIEGIGLIKLPQEFKIYEKDNKNSKILADFKWGDAQGAGISNNYDYNFVIFDPLQDAAYMTVIEDSENMGWYKVCYDQKNGLTGWVQPNQYKFFSWIMFYNLYGKRNGLYLFRDLDETEKKLYSKPDFDSQVINIFERAKDVRVQVFRGNWVLVRLYDYEGGLKIGWLNWRTKEGKFKAFPNILK